MESAAPSLPPALETRPEARTFVLDNLVRHLADGALRVPRFQRGLKWTSDDRIKFLDSLYRGYPVGTLLLWKRRAEAERITWGHRAIDAPARADAWWVIDGQQRLTTLAEAAFSEADLKARPLSFDLDNAEFRYPKARGEQNLSSLVPVAVLLDSKALINWLHNKPPQQHVDLALEAGKRLREYQIPAYIIETEDEHLLRKVFERVNRSGKSLEAREVFDALHGEVSRDQPGTIAALAEGLRELAFGEIDPNTIYRALCAVEGLPIDRTDGIPPDFRAVPAFARTNDAIRRVIVFLRTECAIPHASLLPYELPLIVLTKLFHLHPVPSQRSRILLRRWLWRGAINEQFTGAIVGLRQHLQAVSVASEAESLQLLLDLAGSEPKAYPKLADDFNLRTARTKLACCALAALNPKNLRDGQAMDVAVLLDDHPDILKELLFPHQRSSRPAWRHLANRILHSRPASEGMSKLIVDCKSQDVLHSHGITFDAQQALQRGDRETFLTVRAKTLNQWVQQFSRRCAEWGADDSPPLQELLVADD